MAPAVTRTRPARKVAAPKRKNKATTVLPGCECRSLVEDVAFFRAARFRVVEPGMCRAEDRCAAEAEIKAVLKKLRKRAP